MKTIAITGSISSGKSTILTALAKHKFPTFNCDNEIHKLYQNSHILLQLKKFIPFCFKHEILNKEALKFFLLQNPTAITKLENILYPYLNKAIKNFISHHRKHNPPFIFIEVPLLFEHHLHHLYNNTIYIHCPKYKRQQYFLKRGGDISMFKLFSSRQWSDQKKHNFTQTNKFILFSLTSKKMLVKNIQNLIKSL